MSDILSQLKACVSEPWTRVCDADIFDAIDEIERLRAELAAMRQQRDEARRLYCVEMSRQSFDPKRFTPEWGANELGWDCYEQKEGGGA